MGDRVINGLATRSFNPEQFTSNKECAICLSEFVEGEKVVPLSCNVQHYFHEQCIKQWIRTKTQCPLCRAEINAKDLAEFNKNLDQELQRASENVDNV